MNTVNWLPSRAKERGGESKEIRGKGPGRKKGVGGGKDIDYTRGEGKN